MTMNHCELAGKNSPDKNDLLQLSSKSIAFYEQFSYDR